MSEKFKNPRYTTRPGFMCYHSIKWMVDEMDDETLGRLFRALWDYSMYGIDDMPEDFGELESRAYGMSIRSIDRDDANYRQRIASRKKDKISLY